MKREASTLITLFFFILIPFFLFAADPETQISADQITVKPDNVLIATGNVLVRRGDIFIKAEAMRVSEKNGEIKFDKVKEFFDGKLMRFEAETAEFSSDLSEGIISAANILIDETIKLRADNIEFKNNTIDSINNIDRITTCEECDDGMPLWHFTAKSAINDPENRNIKYRDVTLRVKGLPVAYIPYLRLPNPKVDRARGFLIPGLIISSNLGIGVKLPYFIPVGDSWDVLVTPFISSKTKTLEYRYRRKFSIGDITFKGAVSNDEIHDGIHRYFYKMTGNFKLGYGLNLKMKAGYVNNDAYLDDYSYGSKGDLDNEISLSKNLVDKSRNLNGELNFVRNQTDHGSRNEYYSLIASYTKLIDEQFLPGTLVFDVIGNSALNIEQNNQVKRPPSSVVIGLGHTNSRHLGPLQIADQSYARLNSFVNSEDADSFKEDFVLQYGISTKISAPFIKTKVNLQTVLSPKFVISYNGQEDRTKGDFFIGADELSFGTIYSSKKFSSLSESELGFSFSAGLDYMADLGNGRKFDLSLGTLWLENATYDYSYKNGLEQKRFNLLTSFEYKENDNFSMLGKALISNEVEILNGNLKSEFNSKNYQISGQYEYISDQYDSRLDGGLENVEIFAAYDLTKNLNVNTSSRYDLNQTSFAKSAFGFGWAWERWDFNFEQSLLEGGNEKTGISAVYNDECTRVSISLKNTFSNLGSSKDIKLLAVTIQLKPLASLSVPGFP